MKDITDLLASAFYGLLGAFLGLLIYMFALDGWSFVFTGRPTRSWNGTVALIIFCILGGGWGLVAYRLRHREFGLGRSPFFHDPPTAVLFTKRVMVVATCLAGLYFIWELAKGVR